MKSLDVMTTIGRVMASLEKGAFLTVKSGDQCNTMTIGWATMGICWRVPIMMVAVRDSRHTFGLIQAAEDFTVSLPGGNLRDELFYCGTKSGRDVDKFSECELKTVPGQKIDSPIIETPGLHIECRIVYKSAMDPTNLDEAYHGIYPEKDYHTLYFGKVVACYELK